MSLNLKKFLNLLLVLKTTLSLQNFKRLSNDLVNLVLSKYLLPKKGKTMFNSFLGTVKTVGLVTNHLFKNLDLFGSNTSRNSAIFWRTVDELKEKRFLLNACEVPGKRKSSVLVEFQLNTDKIRASSDNH